MQRLIIDLTRLAMPPNVTWEMLYVALTRVKQREHVRLIPAVRRQYVDAPAAQNAATDAPAALDVTMDAPAAQAAMDAPAAQDVAMQLIDDFNDRVYFINHLSESVHDVDLRWLDRLRASDDVTAWLGGYVEGGARWDLGAAQATAAALLRERNAHASRPEGQRRQ